MQKIKNDNRNIGEADFFLLTFNKKNWINRSNKEKNDNFKKFESEANENESRCHETRNLPVGNNFCCSLAKL